jgi:hypothetical protein
MRHQVYGEWSASTEYAVDELYRGTALRPCAEFRNRYLWQGCWTRTSDLCVGSWGVGHSSWISKALEDFEHAERGSALQLLIETKRYSLIRPRCWKPRKSL